MTAKVYVNRDRTMVVPEGSAEAAMQLHVREAQRLGLVVDEDAKPQARRSGPEDKVRTIRSDGTAAEDTAETFTTTESPKRGSAKK